MAYAYIPVTVTNSESTATPTDFQQLVTVDLSYYSAFLNQDLSNTFFSSDTAGSTVVTSWLESGNTYPFNSVNFWLYLPDGIGASSSITVYLQVDLSNTSHFNDTTTGVAPNLTSTYAEYDDGANVFLDYWNFAGTSLPSGFTNYNNGGTSTVDNGLNININEGQAVCTAPTYYSLVYDTPINAANTIVETYDSGTRTNGPPDLGIYTANSDTAGGYAGVADVYGWGNGSISGGYTNLGDPFHISSGTGVASIYWVGQGNEGVGWNYDFASSTDTSETYSSSLYMAIGMGSCAGGSNITYYWLRTRAYPPNGVMPSATAGTSSGFPYYNTTTYEDLL